jgi:bacterioferritin (cytochrome b1)
MTEFEVLSIHPETKSAELMQFADRASAEAHKQRAERERRLLVEIISSQEEHEAWLQKAKQIIAAES